MLLQWTSTIKCQICTDSMTTKSASMCIKKKLCTVSWTLISNLTRAQTFTSSLMRFQVIKNSIWDMTSCKEAYALTYVIKKFNGLEMNQQNISLKTSQKTQTWLIKLTSRIIYLLFYWHYILARPWNFWLSKRRASQNRKQWSH